MEQTLDFQKAARKNLQKCLEKSIIPQELWSHIIDWIEATGIGEVYFEGKDCVGAWWAAHEVQRMGYIINFTKSGYLPSIWYPDGENWQMANAKARLALTRTWGELVMHGALETHKQ